MMDNTINILASGSAGNCYYIIGDPPILLEAGINPKQINKKLNYTLSTVAGCVASHGHFDHSGYACKLANRGIKCYMTPETQQQIDCNSPLIHQKSILKPFNIGNNTITLFDVKHDAEGSAGVIIEFDNERILFTGDTAYIKYTNMGKFTRLMVECNWANGMVKNKKQKRRLVRTHFSLENAKNFIKAQDLSETKEIILCHISENNGDKEYFKREVEKIVNKNVEVRYE